MNERLLRNVGLTDDDPTSTSDPTARRLGQLRAERPDAGAPLVVGV
jgi:hypothetical protein